MFGHASQGVPQPRPTAEGSGGSRGDQSSPDSTDGREAGFPTDDDEIQRADLPTVYRGLD
ncbi:hypothetical protein FHR81_003549 [Actinoalloteichus hoggarensis]|uniref:Uncharacterized protein n=1 Tax=Actinoalloteichus hoggarensis TaxID=1470176 RepID=A0A221W7E6_9PSEU|nr:hypothetical protein [Actinoalloteichus hoggarensis]ASO21900.1 hypothetical protein AHOG_21420 [Actinoalloteichus hoggarensis]MBB5922497.1 hypothetical protein [Actinoalloteichus hoggarensis]